MKYYKMVINIDPKIIGTNDSLVQVEIPKEKFVNQTNFDIFYETYIKLINGKVPWKGLVDVNFDIEYARLRRGAKATDLMLYWPNIFNGGHFIISENLLNILMKFKMAEHKTYEVYLHSYKGLRIQDRFFILHMPMFQYEYVDFSKSTFYYEDERFNKKEISFNSKSEYSNFKNSQKSCYFSLLHFNENFDRSLDIFTVRGGGVEYMISEKVKVEIEKSNLKGILIKEDGDPLIYS